MDNNQFQLALAIVATLQVIALAWIGFQAREAATNSSDAKTKVTEVHATTLAIADGLSSSKDAATIEAAHAAGELAGRDFEAAKHEPTK